MDCLKKGECGFYINGDLYTQNIFSKIRDEMDEGNIICIIADIMYYFPETMPFDNHHSTFILLYPMGEQYHLIFINSHGSDMILYFEYDHKITAHRSKKYTFETSQATRKVNAYPESTSTRKKSTRRDHTSSRATPVPVTPPRVPE